MPPMTRILLAVTLLCAACSGPSKPDQPKPPPAGDCIKTGCSGIVCAEPGHDVITTCEFRSEYACYQKASCERQSNGACGWTQTAELTACLANPPPL